MTTVPLDVPVECAECGATQLPTISYRRGWVFEFDLEARSYQCWCLDCRDPATDPLPNHTLDEFGGRSQ